MGPGNGDLDHGCLTAADGSLVGLGSIGLVRRAILDGWTPAIAPEGPVLLGAVAGHLLLGTRRLIVTSTLLAIDAGHGWARTASR